MVLAAKFCGEGVKPSYVIFFKAVFVMLIDVYPVFLFSTMLRYCFHNEVNCLTSIHFS
jgi:hypothetical protein